MSTADAPLARPLTPDDLDRVIAIDAALSGHARPEFFKKRLESALGSPDGFITAAVDGPDGLDGYAIARVQRGEFGADHTVAVLDVIGVSPDATHHGLGHALVNRLDDRMRKHGITEMRTQADWKRHDLLRFFEDIGFDLAPYHVLRCDVARAADF